MSNFARHIACKLCRDRKVRCDGGQPACEKCLRAGETCVYVPTHKPTKADLAQTIESLQERLDKAEAYILRQGSNSKAAGSEQPPIPIPNSSMGVEYPDCSSLNLMMPTTIPTADQFMSSSMPGLPPTSFAHRSLQISPESLDNDFMNYLSSGHMSVQHDPSQFQMPTVRHTDDISVASTSSSSFRRDSVFSHRHVPSLRDVRLMNGSSTSTTSPPPSPGPRPSRPDDANHILAEFTAFSMAVFSTQAEIAGISSVVAEYLSWMRKATTAADPSGNEKVGEKEQESSLKTSPAVLEALEMRLREVNALASTKHMEAWRQSINRLERLSGVGAMLHLFDGEMHRRSGETADFFRTSYDISKPLSEQSTRKEQ
ncbi:hypothetical protein GGS20DRAFT_157477 [Poronia punctata]|nr:hypothetical protein GGS20DRAFT_157477 [Poronia punctata]